MTDLALLEISDGVTTINLLNERNGIHLADWSPSITVAKGGGVFQSSSLAPNRQLVNRVFGNANEVFTLHLNNHDQDALIYDLQELLRLLEKALAYWTTGWSNVTINSQLQNAPVWIKAQSNCETNPRYALIHYYEISNLTNPYAQPFFSASNVVAMDSITLAIERGHWLANQSGVGVCSSPSSVQEWRYNSEWVVNSTSPVDEVHSLLDTAIGYIFAGESGQIWRSTDNGSSWVVATTQPISFVEDMIQTRNDDIYAAHASGLLRTDDNGTTWTSVNTGAHYSVLELANGYILAGLNGGVNRSTDGGDTWSSVGSFPAETNIVWSLFQASNGWTFAGADTDGGAYGQIWRSKDNGDTWQLVSILPFNGPTDFIQADDGTIFTTDLGRLLKSTDNGDNWIVVSGFSPAGRMYSLLVASDNSLYAGEDGATGSVYRSVDNGVTWTADYTAGGTGGVFWDLIEVIDDGIYAGADGEIDKKATILVSQGAIDSDCISSAFVSNKVSFANITHVKIDDGGVFSDIFPISSFPQDLYPAAPVANDAIYFGISAAIDDDGPFSSLVFDLDDVMLSDTSYTIIWEYYDGTVWNTLEITDGTAQGVESFQLPGVRSIHWVNPADWTQTTVDSINAYWVRARIASISGSITSVPTQQNRDIYTVNSAHVEIAAASVGGDIPAIARIKVRNRSDVNGRAGGLPSGTHDGANNVATLSDSGGDFVNDGTEVGMYVRNVSDGSTARITGVTATTISGTLVGGTEDDWDTGDTYLVVAGPDLWSNRLVVGLRSYDRGTRFSAYLNTSDEQLPVGVSVSVGTNTAFADDVTAPLGRVSEYTPTGVESMATRVTITFDPEVTRDYYGTFHAFLRVRRSTSARDFNVQLQVISGSGGVSFTTESKQPQTTSTWEVMDFGRITIPASGQLDLSDLGDTTEIRIQADAAGANPPVLRFYDLILIPTDEWSIDAVDFANSNDSIVGKLNDVPRAFDIDSLTNPKLPISTVVRTADDIEYVVSVYNSITNGEAILQANERQRLWFLAMHTSATGSTYDWLAEPWIVHSVQVNHSARYLALRGNR